MTTHPPLTKGEVARYSRQLILPEIGTEKMQRMKAGSVLIVGAGGLASTAALYLAGAGVGRIGIVDDDKVEISNLHRQIIHVTERAGQPKVDSAKESCLALNPDIRVDAIRESFTEETGMKLVEEYDVVVDATDNVTSRYLINDACVLSGKPLVSGSALRWEGQLSVYNFRGGLCYRCAYPNPPPMAGVTSCAEGGVMGAVPGTIGCLQALEAEKILMGMDESKVMSGRILMFNALDMTHFTMKQRPRNPNCALCGSNPSVKALHAFSEYLKRPCDQAPTPLPPGCSVSCEELKEHLDARTPKVLVDVRGANEFDVCRLPGSVNVPLASLEAGAVAGLRATVDVPMFVICRRGIASATATKLLIDAGVPNVKNVTSGLTRWAQVIDPAFPMY